MPNKDQKEYTVCFLFSPDTEFVLLQTKGRTDFKGRLNGVGGKLEPGETPEACAAREIQEETGLAGDDVANLRWLGTLSLPYNCDNHMRSCDPAAPTCVLHYFAGIAKDTKKIAAPPDGERLGFYPVDNVLRATVKDKTLAGNGDLPYFVQQALFALH